MPLLRDGTLLEEVPAPDPATSAHVGPDDDVRDLAARLDRLATVTIEFPVFGDGRGYSQARRLRRELGFGGEIRAVGDVRLDQIAEMARVGIDAFELAGTPDEAGLRRALAPWRSRYQPSYALPVAAG